MKTSFLDFEQPIAELEAKIEELQLVGNDNNLNIGDEIGKLIDPGTVKETLRYFDDFYETINTPRSARRSILEPCINRP